MFLWEFILQKTIVTYFFLVLKNDCKKLHLIVTHAPCFFLTYRVELGEKLYLAGKNRRGKDLAGKIPAEKRPSGEKSWEKRPAGKSQRGEDLAPLF